MSCCCRPLAKEGALGVTVIATNFAFGVGSGLELPPPPQATSKLMASGTRSRVGQIRERRIIEKPSVLK